MHKPLDSISRRGLSNTVVFLGVAQPMTYGSKPLLIALVGSQSRFLSIEIYVTCLEFEGVKLCVLVRLSCYIF